MVIFPEEMMINIKSSTSEEEDFTKNLSFFELA